ncbi:spore germination protein [Sutcliffiella cohnii]|uniref:spore germination protein n=1 Tax=Sutcliffiella cohnii TaxID=33932 RepID=UPI002E218DC6|nr:spore germination protein [Sutcliffiella cohnii]
MKRFIQWLIGTRQDEENSKDKMSVPQLITQMEKSSDFLRFSYKTSDGTNSYWVNYYSTLCDTNFLHRDILHYVSNQPWNTLLQLKNSLPVEAIEISSDTEVIKEKMLSGFIFIQIGEKDPEGLLVRSSMVSERSISLPEVEYSVVGPKESFIENIDANINLIRRRLNTPMLTIEEVTLGTVSNTKVAVLYVDDLVNKENLQYTLDKLNEVNFDHINDISYVGQLISDHENTIFPLLIDTERPDRVTSGLVEGKIAILVDGSPHAILGPTTLIEFFSSFEDYFLNYIIASFFRIVRVFSVAFSILITPIYVAVLSYHYELIPKDLLNTLVASRHVVPLPPILEAIFLELTIELLREAGARLPTKVGQTIGIVGGIVIGTASVEAGLTSNVLLIIIALAALASFTTPVYKMGNTIRVLRFPFLLFAEFLGLLGIVFCFCILAAHLLRLTSLARPYLEPLYPPRVEDLKDAILRFPISFQKKRPAFLQPQKSNRHVKNAGTRKKDIDE